MSQEDAKRTFSERKRNILYLVYQYLNTMGYGASAESIKSEANLQPEYEICDNVDLDTMYLEYCSYFHLKFQKYPKIVKKTDDKIQKPFSSCRKSKSARSCVPLASRYGLRKENTIEKVVETEPSLALTDSIKISQLSQRAATTENSGDGQHVYQPLSNYEHYSSEWNEMAEIICRDFIKTNLGLTWDSICGNKHAISIIKEAVLLPLQHPSLFADNLKPWKAVLMHGPPGTGKTLIAKALCSETIGRAAFFRISPSTVISKWRGESEKIIRVLFEVARYYAPSIIFFDEIESLTSKRDSISEHEASKRFKNEFLSLLDGVGEDNKDIVILATTNLPWEIDLAFLRRFEKKILIDLPNDEERKSMIKSYVPSTTNFSESSLEKLAKHTVGFTGDEIRIACKEVAMKKVRDFCDSKKGNPKHTNNFNVDDLLTAFEQINPIGPKSFQKYVDWNNTYGNKI